MKVLFRLSRALRRCFGLLAFCTFSQLWTAETAEVKVKPFNELRMRSKADVWLFGGLVYRNFTIANVNKTTITITNLEETKSLDRYDIYHIRQGSETFSAENATHYEILGLDRAWDYLEKYGDYVIDDNYRTIRGKIISVKSAGIEIRVDQETRSFKLENVLRYRLQREIKILQDRAIAHPWLGTFPHGMAGNPAIGRIFDLQNHLTELTIGIVSPLNLLPQPNIGLQTNSNWSVFFGVRGGVSGPVITVGWFYVQAQVFAGIRLPNIAFIETSLRFGYIYRDSLVLNQVSCNCKAGSTEEALDITSATMSQKNYYLAAALTFRAVFVELGWEIRDYLSISVSGPKITNPLISAKSQQNVSDSMAHINKLSNSLAEYSRFYLTVGIKLAIL